jgi:hypothetical protein
MEWEVLLTADVEALPGGRFRVRRSGTEGRPVRGGGGVTRARPVRPEDIESGSHRLWRIMAGLAAWVILAGDLKGRGAGRSSFPEWAYVCALSTISTISTNSMSGATP